MRLMISCTALALLVAPASAQWTATSLSQTRTFVSAVAVGDYALLAGGRTKTATFTAIDAYHGPTDSWSTTNLAVTRSALASTTLGGRAFFAGGEVVGGAGTDAVEIYDSALGDPGDPAAWSMTTLLVARNSLSAASAGTRALFAGGVTASGASDHVDIYDSTLGLPTDPAAWFRATLSVPRGLMAAASVGSRILFAGGLGDPPSGTQDRVDIYDVATGAWSTASLSVNRGGIGAAVAGSRAYFAGGVVSAAGGPDTAVMSDVIDIYDSVTGTWSTEHLSVARGFVAATVVGNLLVFAGGALDGAVASDVVDVMDLSSGRWFEPMHLSTARFHVGATTLGNKAILAGGTIEYDVPFGRPCPIGTIDLLEPCTALAPAEVTRLGSPPNPAAFLPGTSGGPVVGMAWEPVIDHTSFAPMATGDFAILSFAGPTNLVTSGGTLLCAPGSTLRVGTHGGLRLFSSAVGVPFHLSLPYDCGLVGLEACSQGLSFVPGTGLLFTNALDLTVGSL